MHAARKTLIPKSDKHTFDIRTEKSFTVLLTFTYQAFNINYKNMNGH